MNLPDDDTGNTLKNLQSDGSDLSKPLEIDFFVAVPNESIGNQISSVISQNEFNCSVELDEESNEWTCYATKTIIPAYELVTSIERYLSTIAEEFGGSCEGFGSYGNQR